MKFTKRLKLVQDKIGSIINELYWDYESNPGSVFEFEYNQLYEIFSDLEDFLDKEYHVKELDLNKVGDGILEIREGIEKKFPGAKFTNDADAMIKGLQSIQRILDGTISKYVEWLIKEA